MIEENNKIDEIIIKALKLKENGKTISEILDLFPEYRNDLSDIFRAINILEQTKEKIAPSPDLLSAIVAKSIINHSIQREGNKGLFSHFRLLNIINLADTNRKIYLGFAVVLLMAVATGFYWQFGRLQQKMAVSPESSAEQYLSFEEIALSEDIDSLEELSQDVSLGDLNQDLTEIDNTVAMVTGKVSTVDIEQLESELSAEISSFSNDLTDIESIENDNSLDNIESSLIF